MARRARLAAGISGLAVVVSALFSGVSSGAPTTTVPPSATLTVAIPGSFAGCYYYATSTSPALRALYDLIRPSAFVTKANGAIIGAPGPIAQAELVSLSPQTVTYTLAPNYTWSDGRPFDARDLVQWFEQARRQPAAAADGYRDIYTMVPSTTLDSVTVTFARPYSDWNLMFRDVAERQTPVNCHFRDVIHEATLGPYRLSALTQHRAVLVADPSWQGPTPHYSRVVILAGSEPTRRPAATYVDYRYAMSAHQLSRAANDGGLSGKIAMSNALMVVGFSPRRANTAQLAVRQFLGFAIDRQTLDNEVLGPTTYLAALATSAIWPQGAINYHGGQGLSPYDQAGYAPATSIPSSTGVDCTECASDILVAAGYHRHPGGLWRDAAGRALTVHLVYGTASYDATAARAIASQWRAAGVTVALGQRSSDLEVARVLRTGGADAGVMSVDTSLSPGLTARAFTGVVRADTYDLGWRSVLIDQWYSAAQATFNPNDAASSYSSIDSYVTTQVWERPLFTQPVITTWSNDVDGVTTSNYLTGIIDQIPTWGYLAPGSSGVGWQTG